MHDKKPRKIKTFTDQELQEDMEKYRQAALELGATDAKVITADNVRVDKRARIKCRIPRCPEWGICANCPPHSPGPDEMKELVSCYRYALLVKINIDPAITVGPNLGAAAMDETGHIIPSDGLKKLLREYRKLFDVVTELESRAFYDGHSLAASFGAGDCLAIYCNFKECQVLKGMPCRHPLRARPSMESVGMHAFLMAAEAGWDVFPIGSDCNPANVPHGTLLGLVLVD